MSNFSRCSAVSSESTTSSRREAGGLQRVEFAVDPDQRGGD
jgi:hypothetical protein